MNLKLKIFDAAHFLQDLLDITEQEYNDATAENMRAYEQKLLTYCRRKIKLTAKIHVDTYGGGERFELTCNAASANIFFFDV